jgi:hypothetical protein
VTIYSTKEVTISHTFAKEKLHFIHFHAPHTSSLRRRHNYQYLKYCSEFLVDYLRELGCFKFKNFSSHLSNYQYLKITYRIQHMAANQGQFSVFKDYIQNPTYGFPEHVPWEKFSAIRANCSTQNIMEPHHSRDFFRIPLWRTQQGTALAVGNNYQFHSMNFITLEAQLALDQQNTHNNRQLADSMAPSEIRNNSSSNRQKPSHAADHTPLLQRPHLKLGLHSNDFAAGVDMKVVVCPFIKEQHTTDSIPMNEAHCRGGGHGWGGGARPHLERQRRALLPHPRERSTVQGRRLQGH